MTAAVLELRAVHARDGAGPHGGPRGRLMGMDLSLGAGVHAVLGTPEDGTLALLDVVTGRRKPRSGTVRIGGADPWRSPRLRARIGSLGVAPVLPEAATVATAMAWAAAAARHPAGEVLGLLGIEQLGPRAVRSLSLGEARALELGLALAIPEPCTLVLYEPLCDVAVARGPKLGETLRARAGKGACVLIITSAVSDAAELADDLYVLRQGRAIGTAPLAASTGCGARELVLWIDPSAGGGARALGAALGTRSELVGVGWQAGDAPGAPELVAVRARELEAAALAVAEECARLGVGVLSLDSSAPPLEQVVRDLWWRSRAPAFAPPSPAKADAVPVPAPPQSEPAVPEQATKEPPAPEPPAPEQASKEPPA